MNKYLKISNKHDKLTPFGFTLLELLTVIILLGMIALVTFPIIANSISDSKKKAYKVSVNEIVKAADLYYVQNLEDELVKREFNGATNVLSHLDIKGTEPTSGYVYVNIDGQIGLALQYNDYCYLKNFNNDEIFTSSYNINTCAIEVLIDKDILIGNAVTSDDGLYLDSLDNTYRYKGTNPNNYVRLFEDTNGISGLYRIIAIEDQGIKLISNQLTNVEWDKGNVALTSCTSETCPRYNSDSSYYCSTAHSSNDGTDKYLGCNAWYNIGGIYINRTFSGIVDAESTMLTYLRDTYYETYLKSISNKINENVTWNIGGVVSSRAEVLLNSEKNVTWHGKIGLMNASDYIRSKLPINNSECQGSILNTESCKLNNWLYNSGNSQWTINASSFNTTLVLAVAASGQVSIYNAYHPRGSRPVVYLKSDIAFSGGTGTFSDPYILAR